jgi:ankyrin repeat protein
MARDPMAHDEFGRMIEVGDAQGVRSALSSDPELANRTILWYLNQPNESDPLHYVSDCLCHGTLTNDTEGEIAKLLLAHGASINGTQGRESPLIAAASLGADLVARVLVESGAELESTALFGARALHWAAWTGASSTVQLLIERGARFDVKCSEFGATPLFWAVHGYGPHGPAEKLDQVGAARALIKAGAKVETSNKHGESALTAAQRCARPDMYELLREPK